MNTEFIDQWAASLLADPITKKKVSESHFLSQNGILDARVYLPNSPGFSGWEIGQASYETWEANSLGYKPNEYLIEIKRDRYIYEKFKMNGHIIDVGGGVGTVREFLPPDVSFLSVDPFIQAPFCIPNDKKAAYQCLNQRLNFIAGMSEFLPVTSCAFDWVHMRSMLDHVQVPDLAMIEAFRVLRPGGRLLVGLLVSNEHQSKIFKVAFLKKKTKEILASFGILKFKDYHTWHPTYKNLCLLIEAHGFRISDTHWQKGWNDQVVYVEAIKS